MTNSIKELQQKAVKVVEAAKYIGLDKTMDFVKVYSFFTYTEAYSEETLVAYNALRLQVIASLAIQERMTKTHLDAII